MARYEFTATHGVAFADGDGDVWAQFTRAPDLDTADGEKRYRLVTTDAAVAKRVRALAKDAEYAITEVKGTPGEPDNDDG